jgi:hypothetical protein
MPNIVDVTFYFANPLQNEDGSAILSSPPESHTLTWQQVVDNVGFSLSTGESMFTELPVSGNNHIVRVINGFYFGTGKYGSLLAVQYKYDDGTDGWVSTIRYQASSSVNTTMMVGNWIDDLTYEQVINHPNWKGKPFIGYENDYVELQIERILPPLSLTLNPMTQTITEGDDIQFTYSVTDYVDGEPSLSWSFDTALITPVAEEPGSKTLSFNQEGTYNVTLTATNSIGQVAIQTAVITVQNAPEPPSELVLNPNTVSIRLGATVTFDALHPYAETGTWTFDSLSLEVLEKTNKKLQLKPKVTGEYSITYKVKTYEERAILYVLPQEDHGEYEEPEEPAPPSLPNTPPETGGSPNLVIDLVDASKPIPPLYKYPNIMKRNSRYRGQRESEKVLNDHQEQTYDIRQLHKDISKLDSMKEETIDSWFNGIETLSISMKSKENGTNLPKDSTSQQESDFDSVRVFEDGMVQLSGTSFEERIVGIYGIKRRMQELDERIAEAERRYREYENAYE